MNDIYSGQIGSAKANKSADFFNFLQTLMDKMKEGKLTQQYKHMHDQFPEIGVVHHSCHIVISGKRNTEDLHRQIYPDENGQGIPKKDDVKTV